MTNKEEQNLPEMASIGDLLKSFGIGLVFGAPMILYVIDGATELANGSGVFSNLIGINLGNYYFVVFLYQFLLIRFGAVCKTYDESNLENQKAKYESKFLRMTDLLVTPEDQKNIMEPMYADWEFERNKELRDESKSGLFKLDLYYRAWFAWRIWRETGIWRSFKMRKVRNQHGVRGES